MNTPSDFFTVENKASEQTSNPRQTKQTLLSFQPRPRPQPASSQLQQHQQPNSSPHHIHQDPFSAPRKYNLYTSPLNSTASDFNIASNSNRTNHSPSVGFHSPPTTPKTTPTPSPAGLTRRRTVHFETQDEARAEREKKWKEDLTRVSQRLASLRIQVNEDKGQP